MSLCINPNCPKPENSGKPLFCLACGSKLLLEDCYRVIKLLGGGGFGNTYEIDDSGVTKVLKVLHNNSPKAIELFKQEAAVLQKLNHPGIPKVEEQGYFTYTPRNASFPLHCLVMEKIEGMDLEEYLKQQNYQSISEVAAIRWLRQLTEILHEVHSHDYFHRDIKPSNIMLKGDGQLVLIDFGTAREMTQTYVQKIAGQQVTGIISAGYTPTEQMNGKAVLQSDFFALGRTFVFLLTGKSPHDFPEDPRTGELIWRDATHNISSRLLDFIDYLMKPFPGNRPQNTGEIIKQLATFKTSPPITPKKTVLDPPDQPTKLIVDYAGFWRRVWAYLIDVILVTIPATLAGCLFIPLSTYLTSEFNYNPLTVFFLVALFAAFGTFGGIIGVIFCLIIFIMQEGDYGTTTALLISGLGLYLKWQYFSRSESSPKQATIGKRILGIKVTDINGNRLSLKQANRRFWSKSLSILIFFIGFIMIAFTRQKQGLHDKIAKTLVAKKIKHF